MRPLTSVDKEIIRHLADGHTTKQIAELMKMTEPTTCTYRSRLFKKVGVINTAHLIAYAFKNRILTF